MAKVSIFGLEHVKVETFTGTSALVGSRMTDEREPAGLITSAADAAMANHVSGVGRGKRHAWLSALVLLLALPLGSLMAGCSGGGTASASASGSPSATPNPGSPTPTPTPTATPTPGSSPTPSPTPEGSALAQAAAQVTPGTWLQFTAGANSSWDGGALLQTPADSIDNATAWSSKGLWNPVTKEFYFVGGANCGSGDCPGSTEVLKYSDSGNAWSVQYNQTVGHTYEATTLDTTSGSNDLYLRVFGSDNVDLYSISSQAWNGSIMAVPALAANCCLALEYFPDRDSLITIDNQNGIYEYSFSSTSWSSCLFATSANVAGCPTTVNPFCTPGSTSSPWARYDPVNHRMLIGGCTNVYSLSTTLALTQLAAAPFNISTGTIASPVTLDPGSGKLVSWNTSGTTFTSDGTSWVSSTQSPFSDPVNGGLVCAPISTYNVIMCFYAGTNSTPVTKATIWLFRAP